MVKMTTGRVTLCVLALLCALSSVSAVERLNSIDDLRRIDFGRSVPTHTLVLLYWFAHTVDINYSGVQLTFDADNEDYGSHHYGNFEGVLDPLPYGQKYYTVGHLYKSTSSVRLPSYVLNSREQYRADNRDRIIFRVRERRILQVFITQHFQNTDNQGTVYDPRHTYEITPNLLRQIREFSMESYSHTLQSLRDHYGSNADINHIRNTWGHLAFLGLFLFIVMERRQLRPAYYLQSGRQENRPSYERNWNTGSAANYTSTSQDDWPSVCLLLFLLVVFIIGFLVFAANSPNRRF